MTLDEIKSEHKKDCQLDHNDFMADEHHAILDREAMLIALLDKCKTYVKDSFYRGPEHRKEKEAIIAKLESRKPLEEE